MWVSRQSLARLFALHRQLERESEARRARISQLEAQLAEQQSTFARERAELINRLVGLPPERVPETFEPAAQQEDYLSPLDRVRARALPGDNRAIALVEAILAAQARKRGETPTDAEIEAELQAQEAA